MLLAGAGLMMRTMVALETVDLGLNPDNILVARLPLPKEHYKTAAISKLPAASNRVRPYWMQSIRDLH